MENIPLSRPGLNITQKSRNRPPIIRTIAYNINGGKTIALNPREGNNTIIVKEGDEITIKVLLYDDGELHKDRPLLWQGIANSLTNKGNEPIVSELKRSRNERAATYLIHGIVQSGNPSRPYGRRFLELWAQDKEGLQSEKVSLIIDIDNAPELILTDAKTTETLSDGDTVTLDSEGRANIEIEIKDNRRLAPLPLILKRAAGLGLRLRLIQPFQTQEDGTCNGKWSLSGRILKKGSFTIQARDDRGYTSEEFTINVPEPITITNEAPIISIDNPHRVVEVGDDFSLEITVSDDDTLNEDTLSLDTEILNALGLTYKLAQTKDNGKVRIWKIYPITEQGIQPSEDIEINKYISIPVVAVDSDRATTRTVISIAVREIRYREKHRIGY